MNKEEMPQSPFRAAAAIAQWLVALVHLVLRKPGFLLEPALILNETPMWATSQFSVNAAQEEASVCRGNRQADAGNRDPFIRGS